MKRTEVITIFNPFFGCHTPIKRIVAYTCDLVI